MSSFAIIANCCAACGAVFSMLISDHPVHLRPFARLCKFFNIRGYLVVLCPKGAHHKQGVRLGDCCEWTEGRGAKGLVLGASETGSLQGREDCCMA